MELPQIDSCSSSEHSVAVSDRDYNVEFEDAQDLAGAVAADNHSFDSDEGPYQNERIADEEFMVNYNREIRNIAERNEGLLRRFDSVEPLQSW